jgi:hypothetical protein
MKVVRIDLQGACEPMEFESKKALKEYLIDFHLQDYHEEDEFGVEDIKLIKSFSLDQICDYFDWGYDQIYHQKKSLKDCLKNIGGKNDTTIRKLVINKKELGQKIYDRFMYK